MSLDQDPQNTDGGSHLSLVSSAEVGDTLSSQNKASELTNVT